MELNPLDARYIFKVRPVCRDCGAQATWRLILDGDTRNFEEFCTEHAPVSTLDITGE